MVSLPLLNVILTSYLNVKCLIIHAFQCKTSQVYFEIMQQVIYEQISKYYEVVGGVYKTQFIKYL